MIFDEKYFQCFEKILFLRRNQNFSSATFDVIFVSEWREPNFVILFFEIEYIHIFLEIWIQPA